MPRVKTREFLLLALTNWITSSVFDTSPEGGELGSEFNSETALEGDEVPSVRRMICLGTPGRSDVLKTCASGLGRTLYEIS